MPERLHHEEQENRALRLVQGSTAHFLQHKEKYYFPSLVKLETIFCTPDQTGRLEPPVDLALALPYYLGS